MFTIFHVLQFIGLTAGAAYGGTFGWHHYGMAGAAIGTMAGLAVGTIIGRLPWTLVATYMRWDLKRSNVEKLRTRVDREPFISHLLIAELVSRGESSDSFRTTVIKQLQSPSPLEREFGEVNAKLWFPDLLQTK